MDCPKKKCDLSCHSKKSSWAFSQSKMLYIVTGSDVEKGTRFCRGNSIVSSAIWKKTCTSEFFKYLNIARVRKASAIWDLWKTYEWFFFSELHEKPCYYLLIIYRKMFETNVYTYSYNYEFTVRTPCTFGGLKTLRFFHQIL